MNAYYFITLIVLLLLALVIIFFYNLKLKKNISELNESYNKLNEEKETVVKRNSELEVYSSALDADKEAQERLSEAKHKALEIIQDANIEAERIKLRTETELTDVKNEIKSIRISNRNLIDKANNNAEQIKSDAARQASFIIEQAEEKAKEIAGEAYDIAKKAQHYEEVAKAMKNVIDGYGDEYLKPTYSLLDDLAEEFGYDEAGQKLMDARERTRMMAKNGDASKCDYVEANRKRIAENFVLDAFNGKVDTILSMIKKDNFGILEQKIRDAYSLVNHLGLAFRSARITKVYLDARIEELRWAIVVNELKLKEKEEQRRIKEQIREEERARREYERAMKEAAKEEETIRKAMEKAQQAIEKASAEQKAKFELQLAELQTRLAEAEAKNQRALSMAQQTKSGHVYIISNIGSFGEDVFKIGMTRRLEPLDRVKELGDASVPFPFDVHAMIYSEDAPGLETALHKFFVQNQVNKVNPRKEFFRVPISEIRAEVEKRGLEVKWTMAAQALEYKESLAIEKSLINDKNAKEKWLQQQNSVVEEDNTEE